MTNTALKHTLFVALFATFLSNGYAIASTLNMSASVLRFQTEMAERGSVESQYKLGFMYETGSGTAQNIDKAIYWYKKASKKRFQPATNRITYLKLKNTGMKHEYIRWLINLKTSAQANNKDALFLLGQMYAEGLGVNKSLTRALDLLRKAKRKNVPSAESYIMQIESELASLQEKYANPLTDGANKPSSSISKLAPFKKNKQNKPNSVNKKHHTLKAKIKPGATPAKQNIKKTKNISSKTIKSASSHAQKNLKPTARITNTKALLKPEYIHPMDTMCSGTNRFMSGCR